MTTQALYFSYLNKTYANCAGIDFDNECILTIEANYSEINRSRWVWHYKDKSGRPITVDFADYPYEKLAYDAAKEYFQDQIDSGTLHMFDECDYCPSHPV